MLGTKSQRARDSRGLFRLRYYVLLRSSGKVVHLVIHPASGKSSDHSKDFLDETVGRLP